MSAESIDRRNLQIMSSNITLIVTCVAKDVKASKVGDVPTNLHNIKMFLKSTFDHNGDSK